MNRKRNKLLPFMLIFVLLASLISACSSSNEGNNTETKNSETPTGTANSKELYTIKYLYPGSAYKFKKSDETEIGKIIKDKFNIVFEFIPYGGNWGEKVNLMLAAKDYPEVLWIQYNDDFQKYLKAGAVVPLDEYLAASPNFTKRYEKQIPLWRLLAPDKKLYKWEVDQSDYMTNLKTNDIATRIDLLEQQGWPNLISTDDWIKFLKQALKDNPTTNGQKSIGMTAPFGEPWGMAGISGMLYEKGGRYTGIAGNQGVMFNHDKNEFGDYFLNEYVFESYKFFNTLYREGILDKESFTDRIPQVTEKFDSGRALSAWYYRPGLSTNNKLVAAGHPEQQYITMPVRSMTQMKRNEPQLIMELDTVPYRNTVITKNAKDPKRIMELIDWATSEEGQTLLQAGIEGKHYTIKDGKRVPTELFFKEKQNPDYLVEFNGVLSFLGNDMRVSNKDSKPYSFLVDWDYRDQIELTPETRKAVEKLGWKTSVDPWKKNSKGASSGLINSISIDPNTPLGQTHTKMTEFRVKNTPRLITAKDDAEFEKIWNELVPEYQKLNPQSVINEYNKKYKEEASKLTK